MDWTGYNFFYTKDENNQDTDFNIKMVDPNSDITMIPNAEKNRHWQMYQQWLADGNTTQSE